MRVLMLGNSLTTAHEMPNRLAELLDAEVRVHARGGARLAEQLNGKTRMGSLTCAALRDEEWDYVVMQEMSHGPATIREAYLRSVCGLCERAHEAGATPVVYATWAYRQGSARLEKLGLEYEEMYCLMHEAQREASLRGGALLADVCAAFWEVRDLGLYAGDGVHPSKRGSELAAKVIAQVIGGR